MQDQRARLGLQQQVLRTSARTANGAARDRLHHGEIHRPSQASVVHAQRGDAAADDMRFDAAAGSFDFR